MADEPYVVYCDDYEAITGKRRETPTVTAKVVTASAEPPEPETTEVAEVKGL